VTVEDFNRSVSWGVAGQYSLPRLGLEPASGGAAAERQHDRNPKRSDPD